MSEPNAWHKPYRYERPSFGEFGAFLLVGERLVCHVCGRDYLNLQTHAWAMHGLSADEYRVEFRLFSATPLWARSVSKRISESNERRMRADPTSLKIMSDLALNAERQRHQTGLRRPPRPLTGKRRLRKPLTEASRNRIGATMRARWAETPELARVAQGRELAEAYRRARVADPEKEYERVRKIKDALTGRPHSWSAPGEANGQAKLNWYKVRLIRAAFEAGETRKVLAARYGVSAGLIWLIIRGKIWREPATMVAQTLRNGRIEHETG